VVDKLQSIHGPKMTLRVSWTLLKLRDRFCAADCLPAVRMLVLPCQLLNFVSTYLFRSSSKKLAQLSHSVAGKVVLISGGASGIGRSVSHVFIDDGGKVCILDLGQERISKAVAEITAAGHSADEVLGVECNVTDLEAVNAAVAQAVAKFGRIDYVVCCAGIGAVNAGYKLDANEEQFWYGIGRK